MPNTYVPGFKAVCSVVGVLFALLSGSMLLRGVETAMRPFGVPEAILRSPHYADYFHFTFVHMNVIGLLIFLLGRFVEHSRGQRVVSRTLVLVLAHYAYLDVRTSDSALGNHLYRGSATLIPPIIDVVVMLCFAWLSVRSLRAYAPDGSVETMRA